MTQERKDLAKKGTVLTTIAMIDQTRRVITHTFLAKRDSFKIPARIPAEIREEAGKA